MSESMKHTPGPWVAHVGLDYVSIEANAPNDNSAICEYRVALDQDEDTENNQEVVANAHLLAAAPELRQLARDAWGALNLILAFYEPGQTCLDTNAWKQAEASGRRVHAALRLKLDDLAKATEQPASIVQAQGRMGL